MILCLEEISNGMLIFVNARIHRCTNVQMHLEINVRMHKCTNARMRHFTMSQMKITLESLVMLQRAGMVYCKRQNNVMDRFQVLQVAQTILLVLLEKVR